MSVTQFSHFINQRFANAFLRSLDKIDCGSIMITTPDRQTRAFKGNKPGAHAQLEIHDWRVISAMAQHGDVALAETYRNQFWDCPDLTALFRFALQNQSVLDSYIHGNFLGKIAAQISYWFTRNTVKGSKKNIHAHYDLGNDFYSLWLDPSMTYSSAIFDDASESLQNAQIRKYDRMINRLSASGNMLEIGCGWGGFTERALQKGDYAIKGLTISDAQHQFASERIGTNAVIALEDYRHQQGQYDQIVSIEMFEAVGEKFWNVYFAKVKDLLAHKGKMMLQTITIGDAFFERYRSGGDAIRTFIFPGGMLPSPSRFRQASQQAGLQITNEFAFGQDYALTLQHWLKSFDQKISQVKAMGFDEPFIRMWRFYLTCCIAAFQHGRIDVMQWELQHAA